MQHAAGIIVRARDHSANVMQGATALLECTIYGSPKPDRIEWKRNGKCASAYLVLSTLPINL